MPHAMAQEITNRMIRIFTRDAQGPAAYFGQYRKFQEDPHWRDCLQFNKYYRRGRRRDPLIYGLCESDPNRRPSGRRAKRRRLPR